MLEQQSWVTSFAALCFWVCTVKRFRNSKLQVVHENITHERDHPPLVYCWSYLQIQRVSLASFCIIVTDFAQKMSSITCTWLSARTFVIPIIKDFYFIACGSQFGRIKNEKEHKPKYTYRGAHGNPMINSLRKNRVEWFSIQTLLQSDQKDSIKHWAALHAIHSQIKIRST